MTCANCGDSIREIPHALLDLSANAVVPTTEWVHDSHDQPACEVDEDGDPVGDSFAVPFRAAASVEVVRSRLGPQGGWYWSWYLTVDGKTTFDHGYGTKREALAAAHRQAARLGVG